MVFKDNVYILYMNLIIRISLWFFPIYYIIYIYIYIYIYIIINMIFVLNIKQYGISSYNLKKY